ncbi:MAG: hypothetical protein M3O55_05830 [Actinomycetota bacterium]|nr:hypothetical protein [Actinomycetota bacterium]
MSRRTNLPGAAELFRATSGSALALDASAEPAAPPPTPIGDRADREIEQAPSAQPPTLSGVPALDDSRPARRSGPRGTSVRRTARTRGGVGGDRSPSGRERHDEKITVYCSPEELLDLEGARLTLRAEHGLVVDRGRIVREALAVIVADLDAKGDASVLVRRLTGR